MTAAPLRSSPAQADVSRIIDRVNAITKADLVGRGLWKKLEALSTRTSFEAIDGAPDSVVLKPDGTFEALAFVYVTLAYGRDDGEDVLSDEYVATISGHIKPEAVEIDSIAIDTAPLFE